MERLKSLQPHGVHAEHTGVETDTPPGRPRLSRWALTALAVPVLAIAVLVRSSGDAAVDLYTQDDLESAGVELVADDAESPDQAPIDNSATDNTNTDATGSDERQPSTNSAPAAIAQTADGPVEQTNTDPTNTDPTNASDQATALPTANAPNTNVTTTTIADAAQSQPIGQPTDDQTAGDVQRNDDSLWCEVEVRVDDGILRWFDDGRTAVFRKNDAWFHTPEEEALAILIPEAVDTDDEYVLRVWGGGNQDVACTFVAGATQTASPATTAAPTTTTTTTTTTIPEAVAFAQLPDPISVPGGPVQMGFNVDLWGSDRTTYWNDLEAVPGNGRLIAHEFKSFTKPLNTSLYQWHIDEGRDLLLTWNGTTASSILNGTHDAWIREHAQALKGLSGTVKLRFWHEPDVSYKASWIEGDPQNYIDAWMYVRQLFVEEGAVNNIEWVWCPTAWNWNEQGARFYPGDANVDWICADGYSGMNLDKPLSSIANEFTAFQSWANQHPSKPILIAEFGATARDAGDRADWVRGIPAWVNASSNIRAVVYFDYDKRSEQPWDWRLRTEADAWQAMMDVLSAAPFGN